jgi:hypothetical protein
VKERFNLPNVVHRYEQLYRDTIAAHAGSTEDVPSRIASAD